MSSSAQWWMSIKRKCSEIDIAVESSDFSKAPSWICFNKTVNCRGCKESVDHSMILNLSLRYSRNSLSALFWYKNRFVHEETHSTFHLVGVDGRSPGDRNGPFSTMVSKASNYRCTRRLWRIFFFDFNLQRVYVSKKNLCNVKCYKSWGKLRLWSPKI